MFPPALAQDESCQVSSQNSQNKGNFLQQNLNGGYLSAKLHRRREGPPFARALMQALFFNTETATHWHKSVRKIELWQNFLELWQIFLEFCQNLAIFTGRNRILGKKYPFLTIFSWVTANFSWVRAKILELSTNLEFQNPWVRSMSAKKKPGLTLEQKFEF